MKGKKQQWSIASHLKGLPLKRLGPEQKAGLWLVSLPLPRQALCKQRALDTQRIAKRVSINRQPGVALPIGQWHDVTAPSPRRLLIAVDGNNTAPSSAKVTLSAGRPKNRTPEASMSLIEKSPEPLYMWERHALQLNWQGKRIEIVMGLRTKGKVHWWEACRLVTLDDQPGCRTIEMGGAIPVVQHDKMETRTGYKSPFLHKHNWLNGHIYARLHANGVGEIFAHHINSKFFDDGKGFEDVVPVIGFRVAAGQSGTTTDMPVVWDGTCTQLTVGKVQMNLVDTARFASPEKPGKLFNAGDFMVLQPYAGAELFGGLCPEQLTGDPWIFHAEQKQWTRGMARTLRFTISLNPERSPSVARYLPPAWWYGVCEEFLPAPLLPVSNAFDKALDISGKWFSHYMVRGGYEDGALPRHHGKTEWKGRHEPGWEGEIPYAHFLLAWRTGNADLYDGALRDAYYLTDVCVDHATKTVRMHGYPPNALAIPMARVHGSVAGYLECGDPYLLDTARAVVETTYWVHKNSWPRLAVGRDACFIRGDMLLYRYLGEPGYLRIARDAIRDVIASQRKNGSFGDQGGGAGIHQWGGYITKPWMGLMAVGGLLDYLEMFPDDAPADGCVKRFADWLMQERYECEGVMGWGYQHDYNGIRKFYFNKKLCDLPGKKHWHKEYLARIMLYCSIRHNDPAYVSAWEESYHASMKKQELSSWTDHRVAQIVQYIPWVQAKFWNARLTARGIDVKPVCPGDKSGEASIMTPWGMVPLRWTGKQCKSESPIKSHIKVKIKYA